ncbi:MAG: hypothetical protein MHM6MM_002580 [Cercozoa sp. M6MM]
MDQAHELFSNCDSDHDHVVRLEQLHRRSKNLTDCRFTEALLRTMTNFGRKIQHLRDRYEQRKRLLLGMPAALYQVRITRFEFIESLCELSLEQRNKRWLAQLVRVAREQSATKTKKPQPRARYRYRKSLFRR